MADLAYFISMKIPGINGRFAHEGLNSAREAYRAYKHLLESHQYEHIEIKQRKGKCTRIIPPEKLESMFKKDEWKKLLR